MGKRALEGNLGYKGERGYSAYEIAVQEGYEGTEEEWINHFGLDLSGYVQTDDVVDDLTHEYTTRPLSAKQGKVLKSMIDTKADSSTTYNKTEVDNALNLKADITDVTADLNTKVDKSGDTLTGVLDFQNTNEFTAIKKNRIINNTTYGLSVGISADGYTAIENFNGTTMVGRLDIHGDGTLYNGKNQSKLMETKDYAKVFKTFTSTGNVTVDYPTGFNESNCIVISVMFAPSGGYYRTAAGWGATNIVAASLTNSGILISNSVDGTATVRVVLMKI